MDQIKEGVKNSSAAGGKTLFLVRHAKSSWDDIFLSDFERPLNERGKSDGPKMAKRLRKKNVKIDAFVSSPAKRAKKTAEYFAKEFDADKDDIIFISALYDPDVADFTETIKNLDDSYNSIALFSHNPAITTYANQLIDSPGIDNMPTSGVVGIRTEAEKWKDFAKAKKELLFFDYPKKETAD